MRSPTQALLYPGIGLLEFTNVSVGRGTDTPFEVLGAPWLDGRRLAASIHATAIPGVRCVPIRFTPTASKHKGQECGGVRFWITERSRFDPIRLGMELAHALRETHREEWDMRRYKRLLANQAVFDQIAAGTDTAAVMRTIAAQVQPFRERRSRFLLYR